LAYVKIRNGWIYMLDINTDQYEKIKVGEKSSWNECLTENSIIMGTVTGEIVEISKSGARELRKAKLGKTNVAGIALYENELYTLARNKAIKVIDLTTFETVRMVKKAVSTSAELVGIYKDRLIIADWGRISFWDIHTLRQTDAMDFPTGRYNSGVLLHENRLFTHDYEKVYMSVIESR
jgi:uncharacterized secreted protein with C-terminal beta-propeller domain